MKTVLFGACTAWEAYAVATVGPDLRPVAIAALVFCAILTLHSLVGDDL